MLTSNKISNKEKTTVILIGLHSRRQHKDNTQKQRDPQNTQASQSSIFGAKQHVGLQADMSRFFLVMLQGGESEKERIFYSYKQLQ